VSGLRGKEGSLPAIPDRVHHQHRALGLGVSVSCTCEPLCIRKLRGREASRQPLLAPGWMRFRQPALQRRKVAETEREALGQRRSPLIARSCGESCVWGHSWHTSPVLCLLLSPFWALWLPKVFCSSTNTALYTVAFYISFLCLSLSGFPLAVTLFFPCCLLPPFLGKLHFKVSFYPTTCVCFW